MISIHPYGSFRESVEIYTRYAAQVLDANGEEMSKPILLTECGQPGRGQTYQEVLHYVTGVEYGPFSDPDAKRGAGFFVFSAMLGWDQGNFPHRDKHGLFYSDGRVRDVGALLAFEQVALSQGVSPFDLTGSYVRKLSTEPGWFEQLPLEHGHDYARSRLMLFLPQFYYASLSDEEGGYFANLFDILGYDAAVLSVGPAPASNVTAFDLQLLELYSVVYRTGDLLGTPLTPAQRNQVLDAWRFKLLEHVGPLTGGVD